VVELEETEGELEGLKDSNLKELSGVGENVGVWERLELVLGGEKGKLSVEEEDVDPCGEFSELVNADDDELDVEGGAENTKSWEKGDSPPL